MCLAIPGKVIKKNGDMAEVDFDGIRKTINVVMTPEIKIGEYCLVHAGYSIELIDEEYALETKKYLEQLDESSKK